MSKIFSFVLVFAILLSVTLSLTGCEKANDNSTPANINSTSENTTTNSEANSDNSTAGESTHAPSTDTSTSTPSTTSTPKQDNKPTVLNPKTKLPLDTYFSSEFVSTDGKTFTKMRIAFHDGGEWGYSYDYSASPYFTKERCTEIFEGWGSTFNEADFSASQIVTVKGVKYYYIDGYGGGTAESCDLTDKAIKLSYGDEAAADLSLRPDGSIVVDVATKETFGPVGTTYKVKQN